MSNLRRVSQGATTSVLEVGTRSLPGLSYPFKAVIPDNVREEFLV